MTTVKGLKGWRFERKPFVRALALRQKGRNSTFSNSFDKTKFVFISPTDAAPQFL